MEGHSRSEYVTLTYQFMMKLCSDGRMTTLRGDKNIISSPRLVTEGSGHIRGGEINRFE